MASSERRPSVGHSAANIEVGSGVFYGLGKTLGGKPCSLLTIVIGFVACAIAIIIGADKYYVESKLDKLWLDPNGVVKQQIDYRDSFLTRKDYSTTTEIAIMKGDDVMNEDSISELFKMANQIHNIQVEVDGNVYTTPDVCSAAPVDWGPCLKYSPTDCFSEGNYDMPAESLTQIMMGGLDDYSKIGAVALADSNMLVSVLTDECGANYLPCLFAGSDAAVQQALGAVGNYEKLGAICTADAATCSAFVMDQCVGFAPCMFASSDDTVTAAIPTLSNYEQVGAMCLHNAGVCSDAVVDQCGANYIPCFFNGNEDVTNFTMPTLGAFERLGAVCADKPDVCTAFVTDQCGKNFIPCLFDDATYGAGAITAALPQLGNYEKLGAVCTADAAACSAYVTDQCGENFIPCLFDDATYGAGAITAALPKLGNYEKLGAVCTADAAACEAYVTDQCGENFLPCLFDDATYGAGARSAAVAEMDEASKIGTLCTASSATCEAHFGATCGTTAICFVDRPNEPAVAAAALSMVLGGMNGGQKMGAFAGAMLAQGITAVTDELYTNCVAYSTTCDDAAVKAEIDSPTSPATLAAVLSLDASFDFEALKSWASTDMLTDADAVVSAAVPSTGNATCAGTDAAWTNPTYTFAGCQSAMAAALDAAIDPADPVASQIYVGTLAAVNFKASDFNATAVALTGDSADTLIDNGLVLLAPTLCAAGVAKDLSKDSCVGLLKTGMAMGAATLAGDAAGALTLGVTLVGQLNTSAVEPADLESHLAVNTTLTSATYAGLAALGPSTCAAGVAKDLSKDSCLDLLKAGMAMGAATLAGDAATALAEGTKLVTTLVAASVTKETLKDTITAKHGGMKTADTIIFDYVKSTGSGLCAAAQPKNISKDSCFKLLGVGMKMVADPSQAGSLGEALVAELDAAGMKPESFDGYLSKWKATLTNPGDVKGLDLVHAGVKAMGPGLCSAAQEIDIDKMSCLGLLATGAAMLASEGAAAAALGAQLVTQMDQAGVKPAAFDSYAAAKNTSVSSWIFSGTKSLGPSLCASAQPKKIDKSTCIASLVSAAAMTAATLAGDAAGVAKHSEAIVRHLADGGYDEAIYVDAIKKVYPDGKMTIASLIASYVALEVNKLYSGRPSYKGKTKEELGKIFGEPCQLFDNGLNGLPAATPELIFGGVAPNYTAAATSDAGFTAMKSFELSMLLVEPNKLIDRMKGPYANTLRLLANKNILKPEQLKGAHEITRATAEKILHDWMKAFQDIKMNKDTYKSPENSKAKGSQFYTFSSSGFNWIIDEYSKESMPTIILGYGLMIAYAMFSFMKFGDGCMRFSKANMGLLGVLTVATSVFSSLCISLAMDISLNTTSLQVFPFLILGLGVDDMFVLAHSFPGFKRGVSAEEATGRALMVAGPSITLTSATNSVSFLLGTLAKMPVVVNFAKQAAIAMIVNYFMILFVFTAMLALDYRRQASGKMDLLCCAPAGNASEDGDKKEDHGSAVVNAYKGIIRNPVVKLIVLVVFGGALAISFVGINKVEMGLAQKDVAPKGTRAYAWIDTRFEYYAMYPFTFHTGFMDYSDENNQMLIPAARDDIEKQRNVLEGSPTWQEALVLWGSKNGCALKPNGNTMVIKQESFYDCLESWLASSDTNLVLLSPNFFMTGANKDKLAYFSQDDKTTPCAGGRSATCKYLPAAQVSMNGNHLVANDDYVSLIENTRAILSDAKYASLNGYPTGIPFSYWQQYIGLKEIILNTVCYSLAATAACSMLLLLSQSSDIASGVVSAAHGAFIIALVIAMIVFEVAGFMGIFEIKMSAIPAVSLIMCVGVGVEFTAHITLSFMLSSGSKDDRVGHALDHMFAPTIDGSISTALGILMLGAADTEFIRKYFFMVYIVIVAVGCLNGIILLPVLLSLFGPASFKSRGKVTPN